MSQICITHFRALNPAYLLSQSHSLSWLAEAHTRAELTLTSRNGVAFSERAFRERITQALMHFGCDATKIAQRGVELVDCTHTTWEAMKVYRLDEQPKGEGMLERTRVYDALTQSIFERLYATEFPPPTDIIHVTCTGYVSPSAGQRLVAQKGWGSSTRVTHAYHMGCFAALPALHIAGGFACASAQLRPSGPPRVDVVHTEICSLHMDPLTHTPEQLVVQTLFADGFIAYTVEDITTRGGAPALELLALADSMVPDSADDMRWICSDWGMQMTLTRDVPERLTSSLGAFIEELVERAQLGPTDRAQALFAVHPGGPKILDRVQRLLSLRDDQLSHSREVLITRGNMSSATLPHIWMRLLADETVVEGQIVVSVAFGPGLTITGAVMRKAGQ